MSISVSIIIDCHFTLLLLIFSDMSFLACKCKVNSKKRKLFLKVPLKANVSGEQTWSMVSVTLNPLRAKLFSQDFPAKRMHEKQLL